MVGQISLTKDMSPTESQIFLTHNFFFSEIRYRNPEGHLLNIPWEKMIVSVYQCSCDMCPTVAQSYG